MRLLVAGISLFFFFGVYAQDLLDSEEKKLILQKSPKEIELMLAEARTLNEDPWQQKLALEAGLFYMKDAAARELGLSREEFNKGFLEGDETLINKLSHGNLKDLFTEFSQLDALLTAKQSFLQCQGYSKETPLARNVIDNMASTCAVSEGRFFHTYHSYNLRDEDGTTKEVAVPSFALANGFGDLLKVAEVKNIEHFFDEEAPLLPKFDKFVASTTGLKEGERFNTALRARLRSDIYEQIMANSLKTMVVMNFLNGDQSGDEVRKHARDMANKICAHCSPQKKEGIIGRALNSLNHELSTNLKPYIPVSAAKTAETFCQELRSMNYNYDVYSKDFVKNEHVAGSDHFDRLRGAQADQIKAPLYQNNQEILRKMTLRKNGGVLFLTEALNHIDQYGRPHQTKLKCTDESTKEDENLIKAAIEESQKNVADYAFKVNEHINPKNMSPDDLKKDLKYLVETNPTAVGGALATFPEGAKELCQTIGSLENDKRIGELKDNMVIWGSMVAGVALTSTGIGSAAGVGLLVSAVNLGNIVYRKNQTDEKIEQFQNAHFTQEGNRFLQMSKEEQQKIYEELELAAYIQIGLFPVEAFQVASILKKLRGVEKTFVPTSRKAFSLEIEKTYNKLIAKGNLSSVELAEAQELYRLMDRSKQHHEALKINHLIASSAQKNLAEKNIKTTFMNDFYQHHLVYVNPSPGAGLGTYASGMKKLDVTSFKYDIAELSDNRAAGAFMPGARWHEIYLSDEAIATGKVTGTEVHETIHAFFHKLRTDRDYLAKRGLNSGRSSPWHAEAQAKTGNLSDIQNGYSKYAKMEEAYTASVADVNNSLRKILNANKFDPDDTKEAIKFIDRTASLSSQNSNVAKSARVEWDNLLKEKKLTSSINKNSEQYVEIKFPMIGRDDSNALTRIYFVTDEEKAIANAFTGLGSSKESERKFYNLVKAKLDDIESASLKLEKASIKSKKELEKIIKAVGEDRRLTAAERMKVLKVMRTSSKVAKDENKMLREITD